MSIDTINTTTNRLVIINTMFSAIIDVDNEIFALCYDGSISLKFSPEDQQVIPLGTKGTWDFLTTNSTFGLFWDETKFEFVCAKYGDGTGGSLVVVIPATPTLTASFHEAVKKYNTIMQSYIDKCNNSTGAIGFTG